MQEFEFFTTLFKPEELCDKAKNQLIKICLSIDKIICSLDSKGSLIDDL